MKLPLSIRFFNLKTSQVIILHSSCPHSDLLTSTVCITACSCISSSSVSQSTVENSSEPRCSSFIIMSIYTHMHCFDWAHTVLLPQILTCAPHADCAKTWIYLWPPFLKILHVYIDIIFGLTQLVLGSLYYIFIY